MSQTHAVLSRWGGTSWSIRLGRVWGVVDVGGARCSRCLVCSPCLPGWWGVDACAGAGRGLERRGAEHKRRPAGPIAQILVPTPATLGQRPTQKNGRRQREAAATDGGGGGGGLSPRVILVERLPPLGRGGGRLRSPRGLSTKRKKKQGAGGASAGIRRGHPPPPPLPSPGVQPAAPLAHPRGGQQPKRPPTHRRAHPTSRRLRRGIGLQSSCRWQAPAVQPGPSALASALSRRTSSSTRSPTGTSLVGFSLSGDCLVCCRRSIGRSADSPSHVVAISGPCMSRRAQGLPLCCGGFASFLGGRRGGEGSRRAWRVCVDAFLCLFACLLVALQWATG